MLCIQGFQGRGYSPEYTANLASIVEQLKGDPSQEVVLLDRPDDVCVPCPFLQEGACAARGPDAEARVRLRDAEVLRRLGLSAGDTTPWREIIARVGSGVAAGDLQVICGDCDWLPYGMCAEGIRRLASSARQADD